MAHRSAAGVPLVEAPPPAADTPSWTRVGVIAAIGFVVGVAWPRLAGVRLGPSLPDGAASPIVATSASAMAVAPAAEALSVGRSEERRVGKSVDLGGRRIIKKKK